MTGIGIGARGVADDQEAGVRVGGFKSLEFVLGKEVLEMGNKSRC